MTSVQLLVTEIGRLTIRVGRIDFYALPVQKEDEFACVPPNILSFADVQAISAGLSRHVVQGRVGRYEWRKTS